MYNPLPTDSKRILLVTDSKSNFELRQLIGKRNQEVVLATSPGDGITWNYNREELRRELDRLTNRDVFPAYSRWEHAYYPSYSPKNLMKSYWLFIYPKAEMLAPFIDKAVEPGRPLELILEQQLERL